MTKAGEKVLVKKHEQAFELFKESEGSLSNADIATSVGAAESTVRKWKSRYKWLEELGLKESVTPTKSNPVTKKEPDQREAQRKRIIDALIEAGTYSPAFDLLIEIYLDAYLEYQELKKSGAVEEKQRREIARLLGQLGLDGKNKELVKKSGILLARGDEENKKTKEPETTPTVSDLDKFRQRRKRG